MKPLIGKSEWFSIPQFGIDWFRAKIDTGKRDSLLHATEIEFFEREGDGWVSFKGIDDLECEAPVVLTKEVTNSEGDLTKSYFIEVTVESLNDEGHHLLVQLSSRVSKRYLLVLGRRALGDFLVDSSRSQLLGKI